MNFSCKIKEIKVMCKYNEQNSSNINSAGQAKRVFIVCVYRLRHFK